MMKVFPWSFLCGLGYVCVCDVALYTFVLIELPHVATTLLLPSLVDLAPYPLDVRNVDGAFDNSGWEGLDVTSLWVLSNSTEFSVIRTHTKVCFL